MKLFQKMLFSRKYENIRAVMLSKKHQEATLCRRRDYRQTPFDKRGIAESLHVYINRANVTTLKNTPTPLFEEPLKFITHGRIFKRLWYYYSFKPESRTMS